MRKPKLILGFVLGMILWIFIVIVILGIMSLFSCSSIVVVGSHNQIRESKELDQSPSLLELDSNSGGDSVRVR